MNLSRRHVLQISVVVLVAVAIAPSFRSAEPLPDRLGDDAFWKMMTEFSEQDGFFRFENFLSNELDFQYVIPGLKKLTKPGGVYLGVGPEQNFTYVSGARTEDGVHYRYPAAKHARKPVAAQDAQLEAGKQVYQYWCWNCYGEGVGKPGTQAFQAKYKGSKPAILASYS